MLPVLKSKRIRVRSCEHAKARKKSSYHTGKTAALKSPRRGSSSGFNDTVTTSPPIVVTGLLDTPLKAARRDSMNATSKQHSASARRERGSKLLNGERITASRHRGSDWNGEVKAPRRGSDLNAELKTPRRGSFLNTSSWRSGELDDELKTPRRGSNLNEHSTTPRRGSAGGLDGELKASRRGHGLPNGERSWPHRVDRNPKAEATDRRYTSAPAQSSGFQDGTTIAKTSPKPNEASNSSKATYSNTATVSIQPTPPPSNQIMKAMPATSVHCTTKSPPPPPRPQHEQIENAIAYQQGSNRTGRELWEILNICRLAILPATRRALLRLLSKSPALQVDFASAWMIPCGRTYERICLVPCARVLRTGNVSRRLPQVSLERPSCCRFAPSAFPMSIPAVTKSNCYRNQARQGMIVMLLPRIFQVRS